MTNWLRKHKFGTHLFSFTLMVLASLGLYLSLNAETTGVIYILIGIFAIANLVAMMVK